MSEEPGEQQRLVQRYRMPALALGVGVVVGLTVVAVRFVTYDLLFSHLPLTSAWIAVFPPIGLALSGALLLASRVRPRSHDTAAYIEAYHAARPDPPLTVALKTLASLVTVGFGGGAGLEGPSMYVGSMLGVRFVPLAGNAARTRRVLLVCGAAAGISAIFKTPLTGLIYALEVPYEEDFAREALGPALVSSVSAYLVLTSVLGASPLFPVDRALAVGPRILFVALALGAAIGIGARLFAAALRLAEAASARVPVPLYVRTLGGGIACAVFGLASVRLFGSALALGTGYAAIDGAVAGRIGGTAALALLALRGGAVFSTLGSEAAGGHFTPFISLGAIAGAVLTVFAPASGSLLPVVGMAAFLAAADAVPIAAGVFVAESTGAAGYVIPGLVAATAAYFVAGRRPISRKRRPLRRPV